MPSGQSLAHQQEQLLCRLAEGNRFQSSSSMLWACESRAQWALEGTQADVLCISCKAALLLNNSLPGSLAHPIHSSLFQSLPPWGLWQAASHCLLPRRALSVQSPSFCECYPLWVFPCQDRGQAFSRVQGHASGAPGVYSREPVPSR